MGFQFAHIQTYSRKGNAKNRSIAEVLAENGRAAGAAPHVDDPKPPTVIYGIDPIALEAEIDDLVNRQKVALIGTGKKIRADTHILMTAVLSHPTPTEALTDPEKLAEYQRWREDAVAFIGEDFKKRGLVVKSVVEHLDESHPHLHVLAVPDPEKNARLDAKSAHPGYAAKAACTGTAKEQTIAYKSAMRAWQDSYYEQVGMKHAQARLGPGRRRLTRTQWRDEQDQLKALAKAQAETAQAKAESLKLKEQLADLSSKLDETTKALSESEASLLDIESRIEAGRGDADKLEKLLAAYTRRANTARKAFGQVPSPTTVTVEKDRQQRLGGLLPDRVSYDRMKIVPAEEISAVVRSKGDQLAKRERALKVERQALDAERQALDAEKVELEATRDKVAADLAELSSKKIDLAMMSGDLWERDRVANNMDFTPTPMQIERGLSDPESIVRRSWVRRMDFTPTPMQIERGLTDPLSSMRSQWISRMDFTPTPEQIERGINDLYHAEEWLKRMDWTPTPEQIKRGLGEYSCGSIREAWYKRNDYRLTDYVDSIDRSAATEDHLKKLQDRLDTEAAQEMAKNRLSVAPLIEKGGFTTEVRQRHRDNGLSL